MNIGYIIITIVKLLLVIAAIVGFLDLIIGLPIGVLLLILKKKFKGLVMFLIIGGPILLAVSFILWALISFLQVLLGFNTISLPVNPPSSGILAPL